MSDSQTDVSELARDVVDELDPGSTIGDKVILSRRQLLAIAGSGLSAGALATFGVSEAQAQQAAGQVGTSSEPVDVFGATTDSARYEIGGSTLAQSVVDSGEVALSGGEATTSTGITATGATFYPALGVDDPGADVSGLSAQLDFNNTSGEYELTIKETGSSQNPTVNYDIVRVR